MIAPISAAAVLAVPLGGYLLTGADPLTLRRLIALIVIAFSLVLLSGRRYQGAQRLPTSLALGALSGTMLGATSIGAPPVILYLLSGPDRVAVTRANLTALRRGHLRSRPGHAGLRGPARLGNDPRRGSADNTVRGRCVWAELRLFSRFSDQRFRQLTMMFMFLVSVGVPVA